MSQSLTTASNLERPDDFYEALIEVHRGLDDRESAALNARLILLLANHIGRHEILIAALDYARRGSTAS